tara:strand:- start:555 stop:995 length:441 start_codon:yes stop_codon:yes gene_type:complete
MKSREPASRQQSRLQKLLLFASLLRLRRMPRAYSGTIVVTFLLLCEGHQRVESRYAIGCCILVTPKARLCGRQREQRPIVLHEVWIEAAQSKLPLSVEALSRHDCWFQTRRGFGASCSREQPCEQTKLALRIIPCASNPSSAQVVC